jgi:hypothetical protein
MFDRVFEFEKEKMPLPVSLAAFGLILMFALGIVYRVITYLAF